MNKTLSVKKLLIVLSLFIPGINCAYSQTEINLLITPDTVYSGDNVTLQMFGVNAVLYSWVRNINGEFVSFIKSPVYSCNVTTTNWDYYSYILCETLLPTFSTAVYGPMTLIVLPAFSPGTISCNDTILCPGAMADTLFFSLLPNGGNGDFTYLWQYRYDDTEWADISGQTDSHCIYDYNLYKKIHIRCLVDAGAGAIATNTCTIDVYDTISQSITDNQIICYGFNPDTLRQDSISGGNPPFTYRWQYSTSGIGWIDIASGTGSDYLPENLPNTTYYRRIVQDVCGQNDTSNTVSVITGNEINPVINIKNAYCKYEPVLLNITNPQNNNNWFGPDTIFIDNNDTLFIGAIAGKRTYFLQSVDSLGCIDTLPVPVILDSIKAGFTVGKDKINSGESQNFINTSKNAESYKWLLGDGIELSEASPDKIYNKAGWYEITLIAYSENGCIDTCIKNKAFEVIAVSALINITNKEIQLYPQPASDMLNVNLPENQKGTISIYNLSGEKLKELVLKNNQNQVDISGLKQSTYFVKITTEQGNEFSGIFIKQ